VQRVAPVLRRLAASHELPEIILLEQRNCAFVKGDEPVGTREWEQTRLQPSGKPTGNTSIESLDGRLREECLNPHWFVSLD
jgi:putative transposase